MAWTRMELARSYPCNTKLLKFLRTQLEWSQKQLAQRVGYSERLICKAESGKNVSVEVIDELATALTSDSMKIYPEDLITCQLRLARAFTEAWYLMQLEMVDGIKGFVHPEATFDVLGDPKAIPFAGRHQGVAKFSKAVERFFGMFEVPIGHDYKPHYTYVARGLEVVVWGKSWIHPIGEPLNEPVPITQRFRFERGLIHSFVDFCSMQREIQLPSPTQNDATRLPVPLEQEDVQSLVATTR